MVETAPPPSFNKLSIADAADWLHNHTMNDANPSHESWWSYPAFLLGFLAASVCGCIAVTLLWRARASKRRRGGAACRFSSPLPAYRSVAGSKEDLGSGHQDLSFDDDDETEEDEMPLIVSTRDG